MVVFGGDRPVRGEAEFNAGSHRAAPAGLAHLVEHDAGRGEEARIAVVGDRGAALHVPENVAPGVADLSGEEADGIDLGLVGVGNERCQARIGSLQASPIALGFHAEYPTGALPAIADLTAGQAAGGVVTTFRVRRDSSACNA